MKSLLQLVWRQGLWAAVLTAALAAGCSETNVRTDTAVPAAPVYHVTPASDLAFFVPTGMAKPYVTYGESTEPYKKDRVVPGGTYVAAVASAVPAKASAKPAAAASVTDQPPMVPKMMAAIVVPPPPVVFGGVVAYQPTIATIPVGTMLDVQAWVSSDLRYVNMNLHPTMTGPVTFTPVHIGAAP